MQTPAYILAVTPTGLVRTVQPAHLPNYLIYPEGKVYSLIQRRFLKGHPNKDGYPVLTLRDKDGKVGTYFLHRLVAECFLGKLAPGFITDHRNGRRDDCSLANLRYIPVQANSFNRQYNKPTTGTGRRAGRKRWHAHIKVNGQRIRLGLFDTQADAIAAYATAKSTYHRIEEAPTGLELDTDVARALAALAGKRVETSATRSTAQNVPL